LEKKLHDDAKAEHDRLMEEHRTEVDAMIAKQEETEQELQARISQLEEELEGIRCA
jgi:hypothetical protein